MLLNFVQWGKVNGKTLKPQTQATYYISRVSLASYLISISGVRIYLANIKYHHHQQQRLVFIPSSPSVSYLKTHSPLKHLLNFGKPWKVWLYINKHQRERSRYTNSRWSRKTWQEKNQKHLLTKINIYIININTIYLWVQTGILSSESDHIFSTFANERSYICMKKMIWINELNIL